MCGVDECPAAHADEPRCARRECESGGLSSRASIVRRPFSSRGRDEYGAADQQKIRLAAYPCGVRRRGPLSGSHDNSNSPSRPEDHRGIDWRHVRSVDGRCVRPRPLQLMYTGAFRPPNAIRNGRVQDAWS